MKKSIIDSVDSYLLRMNSMGFTDKDFKDPIGMFDARTRQLRVRIQHLQGDLVIAQHPFSKAVIKQELNKTVDEYVARIIQKGNPEADG